VRPLALLDRIHRWLFPDKRSEWEQKQERTFIQALNQLKNYSVTEQGGISMDPDEIRDYVIARRQELKHLVDPRHREAPVGDSTSHASGACVELVSWRRFSDQAAIRYVCLQALDGRGFSVASARYFSAGDSDLSGRNEQHRVARQFLEVGNELSLGWHPSVEAALEAHDRAI